MRQLLRRACYLIRRRQLDGDLAEEMAFHREMKQQELEQGGLEPREATFATRRALGSVALAQDRSRDVWLPWWLQGVGQDLRLALRSLRKAPGYTCAMVVTLGLVIGANSALFSAVYAVLLKPLPIRQPNQLVICWGRDPSHNLPVVELSYQNFQDWATHSRSFSQAAAIGSSTWPLVLDRRGEHTRLSAAGVSVSFFETLGVIPEVGRGFHSEDDAPNAPGVVVLSHRLWMTRFGGNPHVVGTTIQLTTPYTVVGVMPDAFDFPRGTDVWTPVVPILADSAHGWHADTLKTVGVLFVIGRLRNGVTPALAADELDRLADQLQHQGAAPRFGTAVVVTPWLAYVLGLVRPVLWMLLAAVGVLLLIACANVSGLLLTRVTLRRREDAVRRALGATGPLLSRQWLMEPLVLSSLGGTLGLIASQWMTRAIVALAPDDVPRLTDISINVPVASFTFVVIVATAVLCGAGPSWSAGHAHVMEALQDAARSTPGRESQRSRASLLILQMALSVVLLVAAALVVRSVRNLRQIPLGFVPSQVITMAVVPQDPKPSANQWMHELLDQINRLPGVDAAGSVYLRPLALGPIGQETSVLVDGQADTPEAKRQNPLLNYQVATPGYFSAMRIALRQGRLFNNHDIAGALRVAVVSEGTARRLWPGQDAVGQRLLLPSFIPDRPQPVWRAPPSTSRRPSRFSSSLSSPRTPFISSLSRNALPARTHPSTP